MILYFNKPKRLTPKILGIFFVLLFFCLSAESTKKVYKTIAWEDLIPKAELEILMNPPSYITDTEDGSLEDQISNQLQNTISAANNDSYQLALVSTNVVAEMDNKAVRLPGFIVPLEFNDEKAVTQFFIVPYFGACIHVPPPPPNQIILVNYSKGLKVDELYRPYWILGTLKTSITKNEVATSAYSIQMSQYEEYKEQN